MTLGLSNVNENVLAKIREEISNKLSDSFNLQSAEAIVEYGSLFWDIL